MQHYSFKSFITNAADEEIDVVVEIDHSPGTPATRDEPSDPPECYITSVKDDAGLELLETMSESMIDTLKERGYEHASDRQDDRDWERRED